MPRSEEERGGGNPGGLFGDSRLAAVTTPSLPTGGYLRSGGGPSQRPPMASGLGSVSFIAERHRCEG